MRKTLFLVLSIVLLMTVSVCCADFSAKSSQHHSLLFQTDAGSTGETGDKALYDRAYSLYESKKYYSAYQLFNQSQYGDWERMAKKCIRRWPKDGELWHDPNQWLRDTQLTFRVEQPEDTAIFFRVYKDNSPVSYVFIGGSGEVTISLPGNQSYMIKDGVGADWFGPDDAFGDNAAYETMTFTERDETTYYFERTLDYLITVNIEDVIGEPIGSEDEIYTGFVK